MQLALAVAAVATAAWAQPVALTPPAGCPVLGCPKGSGEKAKKVVFRPAHFTCRKCDVDTCPGCAVLCDLSECLGEFFTQECWCKDERRVLNVKAKTHKVYCDRDCAGGVCDTKGFRCRRREEACKPWWWCEREQTPLSYLQVGGDIQRLSGTGLLRRGDRGADGKASAEAVDLALRISRFRPSRFDCFSAALPPRIWNKTAMMWVDAGYILLDRRTCEGSQFNKKCFCWDNFRYLKGVDPMTSEFDCDNKCEWGPCAGKTCARQPPPRLTTAPPVPQLKDDKPLRGGMVMVPVDGPNL